MTHTYQCTCCDSEGVVCKKCDTLYPKTEEYFYKKTNGTLRLSECKSCKKAYSKVKEKTRAPRKRDRREYNRLYYQRKKEEKELQKKKELETVETETKA